MLATVTFVHVILSLIGIGSGLVVMYGLLNAKRLDRWTAWFLWTTVATSVTAFMFPFHRFLPSYVIAILSLIVLAIAIPARYVYHLNGAWRRTYVITAMIALYFNVFVLIAQLFRRVPALKELAPTQSEPPFLIAQVVVMILFIVLGIRAASRFQNAPDLDRPHLDSVRRSARFQSGNL